ncbi:ATP-binding cassette domain-containing protein [Cytobacillus oceanisediminis]|jgi:ABC-2 type transport system ATP-binding protein|uniref:ATP-binding cassette domain-containing protein n=1 Tax=Niallia alba TaxID=2729105 RepID=A0A7Y0KCL5_9BACI|nr:MULTISPECIES: ATP-binding cassette domain-containing protein [Bacillaceae]EOR24046.1 ABC transporter [Niallia nealsonii AAU1]MBZ9535403.1 ATP-binding cassette domain-containing protein [Cytobacillus oceanisediminis]MDU1844919.1 ATP-binding cassette domain-containing protein [Niallia nealsonii]NMO79795.1 ATP-binding cassette domain-containing protein [Niallia alba]
MSLNALEVTNLTKRIKGRNIVDNVSFSVEKGEIFGLLGPNGAGKTTIIRMIVNLINRTNGKVVIDSHNVDNDFSKAMSSLGAIVENPEFYKYMSGYKNLKHYARMAKEPITEERFNEVIKLVGLENAIHQKVKTYSLGMRQRLGVAQALLHNPTLLILDEPTNGLDPQGIREFRDYLHLLASQGISVLVSSHLLSEMQLMCHRFAIIEKGKLIHISKMDETVSEEEEVSVREVTFELESPEKAVDILRNSDIKVEEISIKERELVVKLAKETIPLVNKLFVENDVAVYGIYVVKATLEDRFLEITNQKREEETK